MNTYAKVPPHSAEAEECIIGAIAMYEDAWGRVSVLLQPSDFYRPVHQRIFELARGLDERGQPVDGATLVDAAAALSPKEQDEIIRAVGECAESVISARNLEHYAKAIRDRKLERDMIAVGWQIGDLGFFGEGTAQDKLDEAQRLLLGLTVEQRESSQRRMVEVLTEVTKNIEQRREWGKEIHGLSTGYPDVDYRWRGMNPGNLIILAGRPAMGKSTLALNIAENVAAEGHRVMFFSLEMTAEELVERSVASRGGIEFDRVQSGRFDDADWPRFVSAASHIKGLDVLIDDRGGVDVAYLRSRARRAAMEKLPSLIIIDHLQLMRGPGKTETEVITNITRDMKALAKELRCPILLLSQLNREVDKRPYGKQRPVMADLRQSGSIEQDADVVAFCYRNAYYKPECRFGRVAELISAKIRNGRPGTTYLREDFQHCRFQSYAGDKPEYDQRGDAEEDDL